MENLQERAQHLITLFLNKNKLRSRQNTLQTQQHKTKQNETRQNTLPHTPLHTMHHTPLCKIIPPHKQNTTLEALWSPACLVCIFYFILLLYFTKLYLYILLHSTCIFYYILDSSIVFLRVLPVLCSQELLSLGSFVSIFYISFVAIGCLEHLCVCVCVSERDRETERVCV